MTKTVKIAPAEKNKVTLGVKLGFGTGHILNDMCASMWFTYLLLYFHKVLGFSNSLAGVVMAVGQIADGFSTVYVGYYQDRDNDWCLCRVLNKRKAWHLVGSIILAVSFPFVFNSCIGCNTASDSLKIAYYSFFIVLVQFGWACAQISHLALIPDLAQCKLGRTTLTSYRYSATILSNLVVFFSMWAFLGPLSSDTQGTIGPDDAPIFRNVAFISVGVGSVMVLIFHVVVPLGGPKFSGNGIEDSLLPDKDQTCNLKADKPDKNTLNDNAGGNYVAIVDDDQPVQTHSTHSTVVCLQDEPKDKTTIGESRKVEPMKISDWFREPQFYQVSALYSSSRLFVNLAQSYITLYLDITLQLRAISVAIIPLIMYLVSLATSQLMNSLTRTLGRRGAFAVACTVALAGSIWVWFGDDTDSMYTTKFIFIVAGLFGAGGSSMLITSLSAIADLIGENKESGAMVYGMTSLTDKFANAIAFVVIQVYVPKSDEATRKYYPFILVFICGGTSIFSMFVLLTMVTTKLGSRRRDKRRVKN